MTTTTPLPPATVAPTGCCPPFDPATWDEHDVEWNQRPFLKAHVKCLFHVPLNMDSVMTKAMAQIEAAGVKPAQGLMLADDSSLFGTELFIDVTGPVPGAEMATLSGRFLTRVFDGPFHHAGRWAQEMKRWVAGKGHRLEKLYFAYTTCPSCAKAYGHNYVVGFAQVESPPN